MPIEILGMIATTAGSESTAVSGPVVDAAYVREFSRAHEESGFDRVLIGYSASSPDGFAVAAAALHATERLKVLIAHRPGFVAPTVVARKLATLDHLTGGGRVAIHHITGGSEADQRRDGDFSAKSERYRRTGEFIEVLRRTLASDEPFDYEGDFYRVQGAFSAVKPATEAGIPIFFGGLSDGAVDVGAGGADVYMLFGEPLAEVAENIRVIRAAAAARGRTVEFSLSTRPIIGATEAEAWERADRIHAETAALIRDRESGDTLSFARPLQREQNAVSADRLQQAALRGDVHDERLWLGITKLTGPSGNSTAPVGTPAQVAEALLKYYDLGVTRFLIRGFDPLGDVREWGDELVPALREGARLRDEARAARETGAARETRVA
ncbi:LLM class flavin-dependent oxidoreductase [Microbacterium foliorum]|uniref:LLM class flavin-dependent oxidoreductase n=1 Tax=Microbacterium foliorum TaxID=104336 RepID=UPI001DD050B8|nr:LLM class flavin-dependent oxidoreductase [Microbacterium foliorum]CAH0157424.1 Methanesulfonate monooxygenase [Microbacterium foliorum]CAH0172501.1 Methanesulfonate monooxygenase [Microbacterium foliorum]